MMISAGAGLHAVRCRARLPPAQSPWSAAWTAWFSYRPLAAALAGLPVAAATRCADPACIFLFGLYILFGTKGRAQACVRLWVPKTCVTWADALESAVPCPVPGEPVSGRPDVR